VRQTVVRARAAPALWRPAPKAVRGKAGKWPAGSGQGSAASVRYWVRWSAAPDPPRSAAGAVARNTDTGVRGRGRPFRASAIRAIHLLHIIVNDQPARCRHTVHGVPIALRAETAGHLL